MSIHKTGPKAYEYQYLATVYFTLSLLKENKQINGLRIEAAGSEDAELLIVEQAGHTTLEIQVKTDKENYQSFLRGFRSTFTACIVPGSARLQIRNCQKR